MGGREMTKLMVVHTQDQVRELIKSGCFPDWKIMTFEGPYLGKLCSDIVILTPHHLESRVEAEKIEKAIGYIMCRLMPGGRFVRI
ncbi:MAG: hypothetical protein V4721_00535 [Bacteroidota bacterium]